MANVTQWLTWL